jgi:membrane associated rhomboid family serine protease
MGESDRYIDYNRKRIFGADANPLMVLICINALAFVLLFFIEIICHVIKQPATYFPTEIAPWFLLSKSAGDLLTKPWTVFSYMFSHTSFILVLTNLLWLWVFGSVFQQVTGYRKLVPVYIYGGLAGAVAFILAANFIPAFNSHPIDVMQGANSAIMAVAIATTALAPNFRFFQMLNGGIPLWVITLLYVVVDFVGVRGGNGANSFAHIAGAAAGYLFVLSLRKGYDWSTWMIHFYDWFSQLFNPNKPKINKNRVKEKVFYKTGNQKPYVKTTNITQQRIDEILDKINVKGYHLLTEEEKNILKRASDDL